MFYRSLIGAIALVAVPCVTIVDARALDDAKYPDLKGQWVRAEGARGVGRFDPTKPPGRGQEAPLTAEYQAIYEANLADQASGGQGIDPTYRCLSPGMPRIMHAYSPMEFVVTADTTHILIEHIHDSRRIHTDGRDWPADMDDNPMFRGYSIGRWIDEDGDGRYDVLDAETRHFKGPRAFDASGLPLAFDNQSVFKERFFIDKTNPDIIHVLTTVTDNALTRPWTADRQYMRFSEKPVQWPETWCQEGNANVLIGKENYFLRTDGVLMPAKRNQAPPDLRYFNQPQK